jgi:putative ATPase
VEVVGLPEANYAMTHAAMYLALAPKSDSVKTTIGAAKSVVEADEGGEVPPHLRSGSTAGDKEFGFGVGYLYPHDDPRAVVSQPYLPDSVANAITYRPKRVGDEGTIADRLEKIDRILGKPERS